MTKTLKDLAKEALLVQDACNLCGVAQAFARAMIDLGQYTNGTQERNHHPITRLWVSKLASLSGGYVDTPASDWTKVQDLAES